MATTFCFPFNCRDSNYSAKFYSTDGEEYTADCRSNNLTVSKGSASVRCPYGFPAYGETAFGSSTYDIKIQFRWTVRSSKFIKISFYDQNSMQMRFNDMKFVKDQVSILFTYGLNYNTSYVIVLEVIPSVRLTENTNSKPSGVKSDGMNKTSTKNEPVKEKKLEQLSTDMKDLLTTGKLSDIVLTDGSNDICAHKLILSVRSPVFEKMFLHPMKENRENRITIKDISIDVLRELLHFMYTGTVTIKDSKMARNLYVAADKYYVKGLRDICSVMLKSVDLYNVLDTLLLGDLYSDKILKESALHFIAKNYSQLKTLQNWNSFMKENQTLAIEILSFVIDKHI